MIFGEVDGKLLIFDAHSRPRLYGSGDKCVAPDDHIVTDDRFTAENRSTGIDSYIVLDSGVTLFVFQALTAPCGKCAYGNALIYLDIVADYCSFTHNNARAVVDEEIFSDSRTGMNVDTRYGVGVLGHDTGYQRYSQLVQLMCQTIDHDSIQSGIGIDYLVLVECRRVAVKSRLHIGLYIITYLRYLGEELNGDALGAVLGVLVIKSLAALYVAHNYGYLLYKIVQHVLQLHRSIVVDCIDLVILIAEKAWKDYIAELVYHLDYNVLVGLRKAVISVYIPLRRIVGEYHLYKIIQLCFYVIHLENTLLNESRIFMKPFSALDISKEIIARYVHEGSICIDATMGRGFDTAYLCSLAGKTGKVIAFDIQQAAIDSTAALLDEQGYTAELHLESHINMDKYAAPRSVDCITFNLGWLPGGDHTVHTNRESTITALEKALELLSPKGLISLIIYYGRDTGFEEKAAVEEFLRNVDPKKYTVITAEFTNRPNCPPIPVFIINN